MKRDDIENSDSIHGIIIKFLKLKQKPVTMREITDYVLQQRKLDTKTPGQTIRGVILRSRFIKKNIFAKFELSD